MKARTKFEKRIEVLAKQLPALSKEQECWMLKQVDMVNATSWWENYYTIITTIEDCQVFRVFMVYVYSSTNKSGYANKTSYYKSATVLGECYQIWVNTKGQHSIYGHCRSGFCNYIHANHIWRFRTSYYRWNDKAGCYEYIYDENHCMTFKRLCYTSSCGYKFASFRYPVTSKDTNVYPNIELLPEFVRNSGGESFNGYEGDEFVQMMMNPTMEWLWKVNRPMFEYFYGQNIGIRSMNRWKVPLKIAMRHKYHGLDKKYIAVWKDMVEALMYLKKDLHNPYYVCPENLKDAHDKYIAMMNKKKEAALREKNHLKALEEARRKIKENEMYIKRVAKYKDIRISNDTYDIFVCPTIQDMAEEGYNMNHCVYSCRYYDKPNSLILFCRDKYGERVVTIELLIKSMTIGQCYAKHDRVHSDDKAIRKLLMDNIDLIKNAREVKSLSIAKPVKQAA